MTIQSGISSREDRKVSIYSRMRLVCLREIRPIWISGFSLVGELVVPHEWLGPCSHLVPEHGTKWCFVQTLGTQDINTHFSAWVQGLNLVLGHGHCARILGCVLEKTVCSHYCPAMISARHQVWTWPYRAQFLKARWFSSSSVETFLPVCFWIWDILHQNMCIEQQLC